MSEETKILDSKIKLSATCVRVPVFIGHAEAVNIETKKQVSPEELREVLGNAPGVSVVDSRIDGGYVTPDETTGEDEVFVSRVRSDITVKHGVSLWIAADNLRKGAALNSVQIAEELIKYLKWVRILKVDFSKIIYSEKYKHSVPRTVTSGDVSLYLATTEVGLR